MATTPPPYDPNNPNDPRNDPRWQREAARAQAKANRQAWRDYSRAQREQWRAYNRSIYRTSIVGPILLITLGVLFLYEHFGPLSMGEFMDRYAKWWPLLLIGIGVVRIIEWSVVRNRTYDGVPVRYVMGGGTRFLIFLLIFLGIGFSFSHGARWNWSGDSWEKVYGNKHESDPAPLLQSIPAGATVSISNPYGDVTVNGLSDDGQMHINAHNEVWVRNDNDAESKLKALASSVKTDGNTIAVTVPSNDTAHADLTVSLPAGTLVTVNADHGDVHVGDMKSNVTVNSNHGNLQVKAITGNVALRSNYKDSDISVANVQGNVALEGKGDEISISQVQGAVAIRGEYYSTIRVQQVSSLVTFKSMRTDMSVARLDGQLEMGNGDDFRLEQVVGPVSISTKSRNIELTRVTGDVNISNSHGSVTVAAVKPTGAVNISNSDGSVTVSMPQSAAFTVQADTSDGDVHSEFTLSSRSSENAGSLSGNVNGGGKPVRIRTSHGDITLQHGDMPALPNVPAPPAPPAAPAAPAPPSIGVSAAQEGISDALREIEGEIAQAQKALSEAKTPEDKRAAQIQLQALKSAEQSLKSAAKQTSTTTTKKKQQSDSY